MRWKKESPETKIRRLKDKSQREAKRYVEKVTENHLRASTHQGDTGKFSGSSVGRQCLLNGTLFVAKSAITDPSDFVTADLDGILLEADGQYQHVVNRSSPGSIRPDGFLDVSHLGVFDPTGLSAFGETFALHYPREEEQIVGSLSDSAVADGFGATVRGALRQMFSSHNGGLFISNQKTFGVCCRNGRFFMFNSHECDRRGRPSWNGSGTAVLSSCGCIDELAKLLVEASGSPSNAQFSLDWLDIEHREFEKGKSEVAKAEREKIVQERDLWRSLCVQLTKERDAAISELAAYKNEAKRKIDALSDSHENEKKRRMDAKDEKNMLVNADLGVKLASDNKNSDYNDELRKTRETAMSQLPDDKNEAKRKIDALSESREKHKKRRTN